MLREESAAMRVLLVHPSPLMYSEGYSRLEPLGLERVAAALEAAGHTVRLLDLQVFRRADYRGDLETFAPHAVGFSVNHLASVPEVVDLARDTRARRRGAFVFVGGHSASFIASEILDHADGAIDCVVRGEGEVIAPLLLEAIGDPRLETLPGVVTRHGAGPSPTLLRDLDRYLPARHLARRRHQYRIGALDPCASVELTRGGLRDGSFVSAWTFYGRSDRKASPEAAVEDLARIREPNVFIVDDAAFVHGEHGFAIAREIERRLIRKAYGLETRGHVLVRNQELFAYWSRLGPFRMVLGIEALDEEALRLHRKRVTLNEDLRALEIARSLGIAVAINIIADPGWDEARFRTVREWALGVPEVVHVTVATPYPGTERWLTESRQLTTRDYRLFDAQHAVLPTTLPLERFYRELVLTQSALDREHLGGQAVRRHGDPVYDLERHHADHARPVRYQMRPPRLLAKHAPLPSGERAG
jgi:magnesium-protoporphyrin IX monomethyl ester (oxidative) cyclase